MPRRYPDGLDWTTKRGINKPWEYRIVACTNCGHDLDKHDSWDGCDALGCRCRGMTVVLR